ncbi:MAG TPA: hypothetical protein VMC80_03365 [Patescibacteria group bacterium]|nr:hypothetical protein [Patescibacteria group bacterium]
MEEHNNDRGVSYLVRRVVFLTTKVKTAIIGNSVAYYNYEDEEMARITPDKREFRLTNKTDEETRQGIKDILGERH